MFLLKTELQMFSIKKLLSHRALPGELRCMAAVSHKSVSVCKYLNEDVFYVQKE